MNIIGVDFSGAKPDRDTWICRGTLDESTLTLHTCKRIPREELASDLKAIEQPVVAALDFPFSLPKAFAEFWQPKAKTMAELWEASTAMGMSLSKFLQSRNDFVDQYGREHRSGEPKRKGDEHHLGCFSPLHMVNPTMTHMTFRGMQMLHELRPYGFCIPPLSPGPGDSVHTESTLLEVMPGALLKHLELPSKGYKNGQEASALRKCIWSVLPTASGVGLASAERFEETALTNHDCLDSVVAAVGAALWHSNQNRFRCQPDDSDEVAKLEGWLYSLDCDKPQSHPNRDA